MAKNQFPPKMLVLASGKEIDMRHFFILLLMNQVTTLLIKNKPDGVNTTLGRDIKSIEAEKEEIIKELKDDHKFFYEGSGNVYDSYQMKRNGTFPGKEALPEWITKKGLSLQTPYLDVYAACSEVVVAWWSAES